MVEKSGTKLKDHFPLTNLWEGTKCEREDCPTCREEFPNCKKRNLVYESTCLVCKPEAGRRGPIKEVDKDVPSHYVGETTRSLYERSREHWEAYRSGNADYHI